MSETLPIGPGVVLGPAPGGYEGAGLEADLDDIAGRGLKAVVCLIEDQEFFHLDDEPRPSSFQQAIEARGLSFLRAPIEDFAAPTLADVDAVHGFVAGAPGPVYVHCMAGLGRAGTMAAALLIRGGMSVEDAILLVRWVRPGAIQSDEQEAFLREMEPG